jgi:YidC/Oxa1 family membrane protein insertase
MADLQKPPTPPGQSGKKELSMETRLLLAFLLMGLVLFLTPYFYKAPPPPPKKPVPAAANKTAQPAKTTAPAATKPAAPPPDRGQQPRVEASSEQEFVVDTELYHIQLSNRGGVVRSWVLKKYKDRSGKPLELVDQAALAKVPAPFSIGLKDAQAANALNYGLYAAKPAPNGLGIQYEFSDGKNSATKTFQFSKDSYLSQVVTEVKEDGVPVDHTVQWRGGFGDESVVNRANEQHTVYFNLKAPKTIPLIGIETGQGKLITEDAKAVKNGPITSTGDFSFAGLDDRFFAFVVLPNDNVATKVEAVKDDLPLANGKTESHVGVEISTDALNRMRVFVGPKDVDLLRKVDPKLDQLIDWGWFGVIAKPIFLSLHWLNDNVFHNYGWAIIGITVIINLLLFPLRLSSLKGQRKMQKLQPQIAAINAKYKGIGLRDPRKQQQNQEMMELYKKEGYNPAGGCLPMLVQFPILYAFYKVLAVTIELRGAHWLWVTDLSQPEQLPIHLLPLIMIVTQFAMQQMTPMTPGMDPQQQKMMRYMPLMFGFFFYNLSSGLVLYWLTGNLVAIVQQWLMNRAVPAPAPAPAPVPAPKAASRKRIKT